jgi:deoxyribonuclease V
VAEAKRLQTRLARLVSLEGDLPRRGPLLVAGLDAATDGGRFHSMRGERIYGAVVLLSWPDGRVLETRTASMRAPFPYVPGLLSFREVPVLQACLRALRHRPQLLVCDGQGLAHPRRFGLACHLGVLYDLPALGIAKSLLCGRTRMPGPRRGSRGLILLNGEPVGYTLRTRDGVRPVYVSPGHRLSLQAALRLALWLDSGYRIPQPTRLADQIVRAFRKGATAAPSS